MEMQMRRSAMDVETIQSISKSGYFWVERNLTLLYLLTSAL